MPKRRKRKTDRTEPSHPLAIEIEKAGSTTVMYVRVDAAKVATTKEVEEDVLADYDANGRLVGFEVIGLAPGRSAKILGRIRKRFGGQVPSLGLLDALVPAIS